jgi:hypothetical protein
MKRLTPWGIPWKFEPAGFQEQFHDTSTPWGIPWKFEPAGFQEQFHDTSGEKYGFGRIGNQNWEIE